MNYIREVTQTLSLRGRRSRNKVSVGEPAEGSLTLIIPKTSSNVVWATTLNILSNYYFLKKFFMKIFNDGYLGSHNDEERSEVR